MYTADWNSIKLSAAYTYTWMESAALSGRFQAGFCDFPAVRHLMVAPLASRIGTP